MADNKKQVAELRKRLASSRQASKPGKLDEQRNGDDAATQRILDELSRQSGN